MWQFFKYTLATLMGLFLFLIISILMIVGIGAAMSGGESEFEVKLNWI